ncbi:lysozyme inhibitor LprI family protein [Maritimibacter dapengensis]|uniref:DUF1311 domain-containing protein n=1 Tax=Maritimibacter dapengensis TaxID=2836868 RepID=A0ABS6T1J4_9RHOB|nr:lysozyme inhibitor LprI family protein [Maritimibacter dapengensis]MBV7379092.1 DUF1311 domain-containing protein [Maritimibacter dapengensis]
MKHLVLLATLAATPATAQELVYDFSHTQACIGQAEDWHDKLACVGTSADRCMEESAGGYSTIGMGSCLAAELDDWDASLGEAYTTLLARLEGYDADAPDHVVLKQADMLEGMQGAWIGYRDIACDYERAKWQGGTGGGPAALACLVEMTGEQTLKLQADLNFE